MNGEHDQAGAPSERVPAAAVATPITSRLAAAAFLIALAVAVAVQLLSVRHTEEANAARLAEEMTKAVPKISSLRSDKQATKPSKLLKISIMKLVSHRLFFLCLLILNSW